MRGLWIGIGIVAMTIAISPDRILAVKETSTAKMAKVPAGEFLTGQAGTKPHRIFLNNFAIAIHEVTHREYEQFIRDGGYNNKKLWSEAGWRFIQ